MDRWKDRRQRDIQDLSAKVGQCAPADKFDVIANALRGSWAMACERGRLQVAITLAPTMPAKVQYLSVRPAPERQFRVRMRRSDWLRQRRPRSGRLDAAVR